MAMATSSETLTGSVWAGVEEKRFRVPQAGESPPVDMPLSHEEMAVWSFLVRRGITNAIWGLSRMVGEAIDIVSLDIERMSMPEAFADEGGGLNGPGVGVYLTVQGDIGGHLLLLHDVGMAYQMVDLQLGLPAGSTAVLGELGRSALGELGNVAAARFLSTLADAAGITLEPSPPSVIVDMPGTAMNLPMGLFRQEQDDALRAKTTFRTGTREIDGTFVILPTMDFVRTVLMHAGVPVPCSPAAA